MLESELHDLSDDADYAASQQQTWIPYKGHSTEARLSDNERNLYTIRAVPFTEIRSIRRHTPALGWQYIIVVLSSGLAYPPLYFYSGGVKEFLATIKQHVLLVRSEEDANVFLVNDFQNTLQRTLSSLELPRAVPLACGPSNMSVDESILNENQERADNDVNNGSSSVTHFHGRPRQKVDPARDISIQVLEKFSLVTKFARETTSQLFRENQINGFSERRTPIQTNIDHPRRSSHVEEKTSDESCLALDSQEFDNLSLVWGKPRQPPLGSEEVNLSTENCQVIDGGNWTYLFVGMIHVVGGEYRRASWRKGGSSYLSITNNRSIGDWNFSLAKGSVLKYNVMVVREDDEEDNIGEEEKTERMWIIFLDSEGRVTDSEALRKRVFYGGLDHELRNEVWGLLLGYYPYDSTYAEREFLKSIKKSEYENIKNQWQSISSAQAKRFTKFRERKGLIEKDVVRTDRSLPFYEGDDNPNVNILRDILLTYSFYNFDLGYCQGMSDLLSPILFVMDDESEAFWCFVALMERLGPNFNRDQNGMHSQLFALSKLVELLDSPLHNYFKQRDCLNYFFCFRWILIQFKREFEYEKTMRLWEVLWTHYPSEHLHLYLCVAILKRYRGKIVGEGMDFDTLLKFINELSGHIDLDATLRDAEALCICAGENGAARIPPEPPIVAY
ncbi:hypothetical protein ACSQ67_006837 [Phaseolus vulgaris]